MFFVSCQQKNISQKTNSQADTTKINLNYEGQEFQFSFNKGSSHNHPSFVVWIEDMNGNYIQTLFITKSIANGVFGHAQGPDGTWKSTSGEGYRPAALPYWNNKQTEIIKEISKIPTPENKVADAFTGATPVSDFYLITKAKNTIHEPFRILFEVNQPWDWNEYWNNTKYPEDKDYMTSCQPSLIYAVSINTKLWGNEYYLNPIGHGHFSGKDGQLYTDLSNFTTALHIAENIKVTIK